MKETYTSRYLAAHETFSNRRLLTIQKFLDEIILDEECLGFQFWLSDEIAKLARLHSEEWKNLQKQVAHELYNRNLHYLYSAFELACAGLCDPCYNILRTIHESIIKMMYIWAYPEEVEKINLDMEPGKYPEHSHSAMIKRLYKEDMQKSMKSLFGELSAKSHSNYSGIRTTFEYSEKQVKDCLVSVRMFSFYNIAAEVWNQGSKPTIIEQFQKDRIAEYLERLRISLIDKDGNMASYFPDNLPEGKKPCIMPEKRL